MRRWRREAGEKRIMPNGSCLCGAIGFEVAGALPPPDACHCARCRKQSGHVWASTDVAREAVTIRGAEHVCWYRSSERVRRGLCSVCGSVLFWDPIGIARIAVAMGAFDAPTGAHLEKHIFVGDKGWAGRIAPGNPETCRGHVSPAHYYDIADGLPQEGSRPGPAGGPMA
jgi:hypothetical protein